MGRRVCTARSSRTSFIYKAESSPHRNCTLSQHASPTARAAAIYLGLMAYQLFLAWVMPGVEQEGLPIASLNGGTLMYNCGSFALASATFHNQVQAEMSPCRQRARLLVHDLGHSSRVALDRRLPTY